MPNVMEKSICTFCVLCIVVLCATNTRQCDLNIEGYFWRDYAGDIPIDALVGGSDYNGKPIYIGKILNSERLIPAKIYQGDKTAYYELGGAQSTTINIEILCTKNPENFEWIPTRKDEIHLLTRHHLILGGYQEGTATYIGRAVVEGEVSPGKVIDCEENYRGLWTVKGGKNFHFDSFEILVYNPNLNITTAK